MSSLPSDSRWVFAVCLAFGCARAAEIDPRVSAQASSESKVDTMLVFADQARPTLPVTGNEHRIYRRALVDALRARADHDQTAMRSWLDARGIEHRDYWIANVIQAQLPAAALHELAARKDIARVDPNPRIAPRLPTPEMPTPTPQSASGIAWGVAKIQAPLLWAAGANGSGVVIGGEDTGYEWDHPALKNHYRGWNGTSADHNYNWHDAIHDSTGNPCGNNASAPCDDDGHGTHTAGTFAGDDGAGNQIGVAPGARWIGCRNMDRGAGTPARYIECMQWMLAPTDLAGNNANPDLAPDVISNSWVCPPSEGCTTGSEIEGAVGNLVSGGIFYVAAAGNDGPSCTTILDPPATYDASFVIGATNSADSLATFSSRGPVGSSALIRPDVSAPGVNVYSSYPPDAYTQLSGTSMATPHVAGAAALLISAFPALKGKPAEVASLLRETATSGIADSSAQSCGLTPISQWPNNMAGYGRVDVWSAYRDVIFIDGFDH
jgi:subtilisin family serine protease